MAYPTRQELVDASTVEELTNLTEAQQDGLYAAAIQAVESYTGQSFDDPFEGILPVDGTGARELWTPRRLEELTGIDIKGTILSPADVVVDLDGRRIYFVYDAIWSNYALMARFPGEPRGRWPVGIGTVLVEGVWGWTDCPASVHTALRLDMEDQARIDVSGLAGTVGNYRALGLAAISQGNLNATLTPIDPPRLSARVKDHLASFVWNGEPGWVV